MKTPQLLAKIIAILSQHEEGVRQSHIARQVGTHPETVARALAQAQRHGVLLQEDDRGRIKLLDR